MALLRLRRSLLSIRRIPRPSGHRGIEVNPMRRWLTLVLAGSACTRAATLAIDSSRGEKLFEALASIDCHSVNGKGGPIDPDLRRVVDPDFTPATLSTPISNHAPPLS